MQPIALYVHIPFCETKCPYCDFNTYAKIESLIPGYVSALRTEIELWAGLLDGPPVRTVFFGGGTPSYLPSNDISALMTTICESFPLQDEAEITLEANPGDFTPDKLNHFLDAGINRLSIGVQSFDDGLLRLLGRRHSAADAVEAYRMARDAGFDNVSIDLMYGLPHQTRPLAGEPRANGRPPSAPYLPLRTHARRRHSDGALRSAGNAPDARPRSRRRHVRNGRAGPRCPRLPPLRDIQLGRRWQTGPAQHRLLAQRAVLWASAPARIPLSPITASPTSSPRESTSRGSQNLPPLRLRRSLCATIFGMKIGPGQPCVGAGFKPAPTTTRWLRKKTTLRTPSPPLDLFPSSTPSSSSTADLRWRRL